MIALAGLPASGKSALGAELCKALDAVLLDKDRVRECLFAGHVDYSRSQNDLCVNMMYEVAHYLLTRQASANVILDGRTYSRRYQIDALKSAADRAAVSLVIIECVCSEDTARQRLEQDRGVHPAQDRDFELYLRSKAAAEPIEDPRLVIATDELDLSGAVERVLQYLRAP